MPVPNKPPAITTQIAEVVRGGHVDTSKTGKITVKLIGNSRNPETVVAHALMPFGGRGHGIFGPVEPHTRVLVTPVLVDPHVSDDNVKWYWLGVIPQIDIVRRDKHEDIDANDPNIGYRSTIPESGRIYGLDEIPTKTMLKSMVGHKLELAETVYKDPNGEIIQEDYAMLSTNSDKYIKLDAGVGKQMDRIIITDEKDNRIVIKTGDDQDMDPGWGPESITIECTGNMHLLSKTGEMDIRVGSESTSNVTIQNEGTGDIVCRCEHGNTYILAEKDIYVESTNVRVTQTESVFVDAAVNVEVSAGADTHILTSGDAEITTQGDAKITTKGDTGLTIDTDNHTQITSDTISLNADNGITINGGTSVDIDGDAISLN